MALLTYFFKTWRTNQGNLLMAIAICVGAIMSMVWYFDLLKQIELSPTADAGSQWQSPPLRQTLVLISVAAPELAPEASIGIVRIYAPVGELDEVTAPILTRQFEVNASRLNSVLIQGLAPGDYVALVFFDFNGNQLIDSDEPAKLSQSPLGVEPSPVDLSTASFPVRAGQVQEVAFNFMQ